MLATRSAASTCPCGRAANWETLAPVKSIAAPFGQPATQAPHPMHSAAVPHQVCEDGERRAPPRLDLDRVPVLEFAHVELADGGPLLPAVGDAVDDLRADPADPPPAAVVENDRALP